MQWDIDYGEVSERISMKAELGEIGQGNSDDFGSSSKFV